jgi:transposase
VFDAFLDFTLTIEHWGEFIFAYFRYRYTGGFVEAANGIGRVIDRQGRGYSFEVLRARLLYGQSLRQRTKKRAIPDDLQTSVSVDEYLPDATSSTLA